MKKLIISGSAALYERALYWRGYFEGRGYDVIDYPTIMTDDPNDAETTPIPGFPVGPVLHPGDDRYDEHLLHAYTRYWRNLEAADVFFLMNEDRDGVIGRIGNNPFAELTAVIINNLIHDKKVKIYILKLPSEDTAYYPKIKFWLDQGQIEIYHPIAEKRSLPRPSLPIPSVAPLSSATKPSEPSETTPHPIIRPSIFANLSEKSINILSSKHRCLRPLNHASRELLSCYSPDFPTWLLHYIAAPEFQHLAGVSMTSMDYSSLWNYSGFSSVFSHSIGTALITWNFTHDKIQTLSSLFHDIASPSFKHCIDVMYGDAEHQETIESRTGEIIRNSKIISRQLKKDGILPSEVSDYHLFPIADNDVPGLAADRLEYTFSNGYFLYETWNLNDIKRFYQNITVLKNEEGLDELGFLDPALAAEFTERNLPLANEYHCDKSRISLQFIADIIKNMIDKEYISISDLYTMSEREVIDWILSCGNANISEAFRNFQRTTSVYSGNSAKKNTYSTNVKTKIRYIDPLASTAETDASGQAISARISDISPTTHDAIKDYLNQKIAKYVGFDFDFRPDLS